MLACSRVWSAYTVLFSMSVFVTHVHPVVSSTDAKDDCSSVKFTEFLGGKYLIGDKSKRLFNVEIPPAGYRYIFLESDGHVSRMKWLEAHNCCVQKNMRLMSLVTEEDTLTLAKALSKNLNRAAELWTSAQSIAGLHIWTGVGRTLKNYTSWAPGHPISPPGPANTSEIKQECVSAKLNGTDSILWSDENCDKTRLVGCERHPGCKDGPVNRIRQMEAKDATMHTVDNVQYAFANEKQTWIEGYRYCRKQGLQLVSLERESKAIKVTKLWFSKRKDAFWTSGTEVGSYNKQFFWATIGKEFGYHNFGELSVPKRDSKNCVLARSEKIHPWIDEECQKLYGIICETYSGCDGCS